MHERVVARRDVLDRDVLVTRTRPDFVARVIHQVGHVDETDAYSPASARDTCAKPSAIASV